MNSLIEFMSFKYTQISLIVGMVAVFCIGKFVLAETLVVESEPVAYMDFDREIAKIPYETITFGMG